MFFSILAVVVIILVIWIYLNLPSYCKSKTCLVGKTALVTGGNLGLGYEVVLNLASRGCRVIIASRSGNEELKHRIIRITQNPNIVIKHLDLSSLESVRKFAKDINATEKKIDILINNAGAGVTKHVASRDGLNAVEQINHFGPFLLTHLLIDLLKKSAQSRIIFVSSLAAYVHNLKVENLNCLNTKTTTYIRFRTYGNSKLCNIISAKIFAEKLERFGIVCHAVHPGYAKSSIAKNLQESGFSRLSILLYCYVITGIFARSTEEGSQGILKAALDEKYGKCTGHFISSKVRCITPFRTWNKDFCQKIWNASEELVKLEDNEKL